MIYSKPFKSYEEQIELLVNKYELTLKDYDLCLELLKTISYYDLVNGYKDFFMQDGKFIKGVSERELFLFSLFDKNFQGILFKYSVYAENTFKTKLSYTIAKKFGVNEVEYLNEKNYLSSGYSSKRNKKKLKTLDDIKKVSTSIYTKDPTLHYKNNHNHIPPWILFKNITFNLSIDLFSFLQKDEKEEVVNDYKSIISLEISEKKQLVKNAITIIRKFRNKIAHNAKIVTYTVEDNELDPTHLKKIFNPEIYGENEQNDKLGKNDIFSMVLALCIMLENKILIVSFLNEINILFSTIDDTSNNYIKCLNLPKDFKEKIVMLIEYFMSRRG